MPLKACSDCGHSFQASLSNFYFHATNVDRLEGRCKSCVRKDRKRRYRARPKATPRHEQVDASGPRYRQKICKQCFGLRHAVIGVMCGTCGLAGEHAASPES